VFLKSERIPATFFLLGKSLRTRLTQSTPAELTGLYTGMTIGSHGMDHQSHAKSAEWRSSILGANNLLDSVFCGATAGVHPFRPPYGQRKDSVITVLTSLGSQCVLWNIDTQDWNARISPEQAAGRAVTLMLLWRRGIILFHDVHSKAIGAMPIILKPARAGGIVWVDGKTL
jgi:peptidoglycan/xylan/chitin deacetylase (PgdA/CDA1 family)